MTGSAPDSIVLIEATAERPTVQEIIAMLDQVKASPAVRIGGLVEEILSRRGVDGPVAFDAELARFGMTSIDMVEVMLGVEAEFDVAIPPAEITLENFRSIAAMVSLVSRLRTAP